MNKLLLTLATVLLISGCAKEPNIYLNCLVNNGADEVQITIDTIKKEIISYAQDEPASVSYTEYPDKLVSDKFDVSEYGYSIATFNKINGNLIVDYYYENEEPSVTSPCSVIERVMK